MKNSLLFSRHSSAHTLRAGHSLPGKPWKLPAVAAGLAFSFLASFSCAAAVPTGTLEGADGSSVYGWAWDSDNYNHIIPIEISVYPADSSQVLKTDTIKGDHYQDKLQKEIGDGYHGFLYSIDWNQFEQSMLRVTAYAVTETDRVFLGELTYDKGTGTHTPVSNVLTAGSEDGSASPSQDAAAQSQDPSSQDAAQGPGEPSSGSSVLVFEGPSSREPAGKGTALEAPPADLSGQKSTAAPGSDKTPPASSSSSDAADDEWGVGPGFPPKPKASPKGVSLGMFTTTGYCNCDICSSGSNLTYSGTQPQPNHTVSADINLFPMGTRLMIDDIIYTVEDIGSSVTQNKIDIFYATHQEAVDHGTQTKEVFAVAD